MSIKSLICLDIHTHSSATRVLFYFIWYRFEKRDGLHAVCDDDDDVNPAM